MTLLLLTLYSIVISVWMSVNWWRSDTSKERLKFLDKNLSQCHFVYQNPTWTGLEPKPGLCDDREVSNNLSQSKAFTMKLTGTLEFSSTAAWP